MENVSKRETGSDFHFKRIILPALLKAYHSGMRWNWVTSQEVISVIQVRDDQGSEQSSENGGHER